MVVNRARPELVRDGVFRRTRTGRPADVARLADGLDAAGVDPDLAAGLAQELSDFDLRQQVQNENAERLAVLELPLVRLPELSPPVDLGGLYELAQLLAPLAHPAAAAATTPSAATPSVARPSVARPSVAKAPVNKPAGTRSPKAKTADDR